MTREEQEAELLTAAMRQRATGLRVGREVLTDGGGFMTKGSLGRFDVPELVDVAEYIVEGTHPMDRYSDSAPADTSEASDASG